MSMQDIKTDTLFASTFAVAPDDMKRSNGDILRYKKRTSAADLGVKISDAKGWRTKEYNGILYSDLRLRVFTPNELYNYMEAKFKDRLQKMAATEKYLTEEQRMALLIQSERF